MESNKEYTYGVEENHRGKWQPLKKDNGEQKIVRITDEEAEINNMQSKYHSLRYVKVVEKKKAPVSAKK